MAEKYLTFRLQDETYGVPVSKVREIVTMAAITPVPQSPAYVKGVFNLRSRVLPLVDLRARFGAPAATYSASHLHRRGRHLDGVVAGPDGGRRGRRV